MQKIRKYAPIAYRIAEVILLLVLLIWYGNIRPNRFLVNKQYCKGIKVSHYHEDVDMQKLAKQDVSFAYIKATDGLSFVNEAYEENCRKAKEEGILVGAYHFFDLEEDGRTQAAHFIQTVGKQDGQLVPAVDVEYYGDLKKNPPEKEQVRTYLQECLDALEEAYQCKPIIYTTLPFYKKYIKGNFEQYPLWICSLYVPADYSSGKDWTFWQYDNRLLLEKFKGGKTYLDRDVFRGSIKELKKKMLVHRKAQFTFEACSNELLQSYGGGSGFRNLYTGESDTAKKHSLFIGQVIALFGEPEERTDDNENLFRQAVSAKDKSGNVLYLEVYYGPSGPAVAGGDGEGDWDEDYQQKAVDELAEYIMAAKPADFAWESVYEDFGVTVMMGVKDGKPYYETKLSEQLKESFMEE